MLVVTKHMVSRCSVLCQRRADTFMRSLSWSGKGAWEENGRNTCHPLVLFSNHNILKGKKLH